MSDWDEDTNYEALRAPDGRIVATLTEPEDRTWYRDGLPVVQELNRLFEENATLRSALAGRDMP